ncbi:MAG TPA: hypothetical protein VD907_00590 [Verrucomicrobiae bacterium]|nr:hypothetical protein [Verrucomicrobiae bacterium]
MIGSAEGPFRQDNSDLLARLDEAEALAMAAEAEDQARREAFLNHFPERDVVHGPDAFRFDPASFEIIAPADEIDMQAEISLMTTLGSLESTAERNIIPAIVHVRAAEHQTELLQQIAHYWQTRIQQPAVVYDMALHDERAVLPTWNDFAKRLQQQFVLPPDTLIAVSAPQPIHWRAFLAEMPDGSYPQLPVAIVVPDQRSAQNPEAA